MRSAQWRGLYLTTVLRPVRRYFPAKPRPRPPCSPPLPPSPPSVLSPRPPLGPRRLRPTCSSRSAVHVSWRLRRTYAARHAAARADSSLCVRRSPRGSITVGASGGESDSVSGSVSSSSSDRREQMWRADVASRCGEQSRRADVVSRSWRAARPSGVPRRRAEQMYRADVPSRCAEQTRRADRANGVAPSESRRAGVLVAESGSR